MHEDDYIADPDSATTAEQMVDVAPVSACGDGGDHGYAFGALDGEEVFGCEVVEH